MSEQDYLEKVCMEFKVERIRQRMSQERLSQLSRLNVRTISKLETADVEPNLFTLKRLADALGKPLSEFV